MSPNPKHTGPTSAPMVTAAERAKQAIELRRAGASFDQIARAVGFRNRSGAYKAVKRLLDLQLRQAMEEAQEVRALEYDRLNRLMMTWWPLAIGRGQPGDQNYIAPDDKAAKIVMGIHDRMARLWGLTKYERFIRKTDDDVAKPAGRVISEEGFDVEFLSEVASVLALAGAFPEPEDVATETDAEVD